MSRGSGEAALLRGAPVLLGWRRAEQFVQLGVTSLDAPEGVK